MCSIVWEKKCSIGSALPVCPVLLLKNTLRQVQPFLDSVSEDLVGDDGGLRRGCLKLERDSIGQYRKMSTLLVASTLLMLEGQFLMDG